MTYFLFVAEVRDRKFEINLIHHIAGATQHSSPTSLQILLLKLFLVRFSPPEKSLACSSFKYANHQAQTWVKAVSINKVKRVTQD